MAVRIDIEQGAREATVRALASARYVTAICHEHPDADTLGSAVAIALIARRLGAESEVVSTHRPPAACNFLPMFHAVRTRPALEPDVAVICDAATLERVGPIHRDQAEWLAGATKLNIDHHATNALWGDVNLVVPEAVATSEIIAGLLPDLGIRPDADIATALLAGVVRDSQGFSDGATSPTTLRIAATLMEAGAPLASVQRRLLHEMPYQTLALWGQVLASLGEELGGRIVHASVTRELLLRTGSEDADADGIVEFMARTRDCELAILFRELPDGTRVSLRGADGADAIALAQEFGGGGHARRAGFVAAQPLAELRARVLDSGVRRLVGRR